MNHVVVYTCVTTIFGTFVLVTVASYVLVVNLEKNCIIDFFNVWNCITKGRDAKF